MACSHQNTPEDISVIGADIGKDASRAASAIAFPVAEAACERSTA